MGGRFVKENGVQAVSTIDETLILGRVSFDEEDASGQLENLLDVALSNVGRRHILIVCVGTDRSTGDAFGPIIGTKLTTANSIPGVDVFGTLDEPVHAVNLTATLDYLQTTYREAPFIIALDACLGKFDHVGHLTLEQGPLRPGAGVKKTLPSFGDITLTGVVNVSGFMEYFVLQNTRLSVVMKMSDIVVQALRRSLLKVQMRQSFHISHQA